MTNTEIIYRAMEKCGIKLPNIEIEKVESNCMICGKGILEGVRRDKAVSSNFTDYDTFASIGGTHICKECTACLKTRELRHNNFIADKHNIYLFKKQDLEKYLFNLGEYVEGEFVIGVTRSYKKHNSFRCRLNYNTKRFYIREEDNEFLFDTNLCKALYKDLWTMYLYFTKDEILSGNYSIHRIEKFGLDKFSMWENIFRQHRGTHYFDLLVFMLDSEKRNEVVNQRIKEEKEKKKDKQLSLI